MNTKNSSIFGKTGGLALGAMVLGTSLILAPASADADSRFQRGIDRTADAARRVACEEALRVQPHLRWFGAAVKGWDRAAWEAYRLRNPNTPKFPGACRNFARK